MLYIPKKVLPQNFFWRVLAQEYQLSCIWYMMYPIRDMMYPIWDTMSPDCSVDLHIQSQRQKPSKSNLNLLFPGLSVITTSICVDNY